jgi:hypothetical protein
MSASCVSCCKAYFRAPFCVLEEIQPVGGRVGEWLYRTIRDVKQMIHNENWRFWILILYHPAIIWFCQLLFILDLLWQFQQCFCP